MDMMRWMNIRAIGLGLLLLLGSALWAKAQQAVTAGSVLAAAEKSLYGSGATQLDFTSTYQDNRGRSQQAASGRMYLQGESFRLEYGGIIAVYSRGTLTHYDRSENTLTYSKPSADELLQINPLYFLRSRGKGFSSQLVGKPSSKAVLLFTPQVKSNAKSLQATFVTKTGSPEQLLLTARDGARIIVRLARQQRVKAQPASFFSLSEKSFPGCEVVDLR